MPPKRIVMQPAIEDTSADTLAEEDSSEAPATRPRPQKTRRAHSDRLRRELEERGKIPVIFTKKNGRPIGLNRAPFMTELGVSVRSFAPLQAKKWSTIPKEQKKPIFDRLSAIFDVDFSSGPDSVWNEADKLMCERYRGFRNQFHQYYKSLEVPEEDRLKHVPEHLSCEPEDWVYLCNLFRSKKFKDLSATNSNNRSEQPYNHIGGSKPFLQYYLEGTDGAMKDRITLFNETHFSTEKGWIGEKAKEKYDEMLEKKKEFVVSDNLNEIDIADIVCDHVLRKRSGYVRGLGNGPKPRSSINSDASTSRPSVLREQMNVTQEKLATTQEKLATTEEKLATTEEKLITTQNEVAVMRSQQAMMLEILEGLAPGAAAKVQSLSRQQQSSSQ